MKSYEVCLCVASHRCGAVLFGKALQKQLASDDVKEPHQFRPEFAALREIRRYAGSSRESVLLRHGGI